MPSPLRGLGMTPETHCQREGCVEIGKRELRVTLGRMEAPVPFEVLDEDRQAPVRFRLANISRGGMFIESVDGAVDPVVAALSHGSSVRFALRLGRGAADVTGTAKVRWVRGKTVGPAQPPQMQGAGVQVVEFDGNAERHYLEFLESRLLELKAVDLMETTFVMAPSSTPLTAVVARLQAPASVCVVVTGAHDAPVGLITATDLLRAISQPALLSQPLQSFVTEPPVCVMADQSADDAYAIMRQSEKQYFPVVDHGLVIGVLSSRTLIRYGGESMDLQAKRLARSYDRAMSVIAHDLRTPIGVVQTTNRMLTSGELTPAEYMAAGLSDTIESTCEMMLRLIDDLIDISRIRGGAVQLDLAEVDVAALLQKIARTFVATAADKRIAITVDISPALPPLQADPLRLEQVLNNLVSNALKFSPEGAKVVLGAKLDGARLMLWVADTGLGIPAHEVGQLFQDYVRASTRPTKGERSTGLGLAICKRLIEAHGGSIHLESVAGVGSKFTLLLPLSA